MIYPPCMVVTAIINYEVPFLPMNYEYGTEKDYLTI